MTKKPVIILLTIILLVTTLLTSTPCIVKLWGSCSAGKSSILNELRQDARWAVIDEDSLILSAIVEAISVQFPHEFELIKKAIAPNNRFVALQRNEIYFIEGTDEQSKFNAIQAISKIHEGLADQQGEDFKAAWKAQVKKIMQEDTETAILNGKNILIDSWLLSYEELTTQFPDNTVIEALLYCSLPLALEHLEKRNKIALESGDSRENRFYAQLMKSYNQLFSFNTDPNGALLQCTKDEISSVFDAVNHKVIQNWQEEKPRGFLWKECNLFELNRIKNELLPDSLEEGIIFLHPKEEKYSITLNSGEMGTKTLTETLLEKITKLNC